MRFWHALAARLRSFAFRDRRESDLAEELGAHLEREADRRIAQGMDPGEARLQARRDFGAVEAVKEECRDARGMLLVEHVARDARHGMRRLIRDWRFTAAAVLILALGIGANTATFSAIDAVLLRKIPVVDSDRVVHIYQNVGETPLPVACSFPVYREIVEHAHLFSAVTASETGWVTFRAPGGVYRSLVEYVTASYVAVTGLQPAHGRWFDAADERQGADPVGLVGHEMWRTRFDGDPAIVGRVVPINGVSVTIIGVASARLNSTISDGIANGFWLPASLLPTVGGSRGLEQRDPSFAVLARLRQGVFAVQAQAAMDDLGARLARDYPGVDPGKGISVYRFEDVHSHPINDRMLAPLVAVLLTVVGLVLAIACSNLATLLLVRGWSRSKEVSVRLALGATRAQIVRHLLTENVVLSTLGGLVGLGVALAVHRLLEVIELPVRPDLRLDYRVLGFTLALALATGLLFGLAPALRATRLDIVSTLRDEGGALSLGRRWFNVRNGLVVFQVAVSFVLLVGTGLLLRVVAGARNVDVGIAVDGVAMLDTDARYAGRSAAEARVVHEDLLRRVAALPGVEAATLASGPPLGRGLRTANVDLTGAGAPIRLDWRWAAPGYFETLRIPLLAGRAFDGRDRENSPPVIVINATMARRHFGGAAAVGRHLRFEEAPDVWVGFTVIGVARDVQGDALALEPPRPIFYRSVTQVDAVASTLIARGTGPAEALVAAMERELRAVDAALPVIAATTMRRSLDETLVASYLATWFLGLAGAIGLSLASVGLYALVAFAVARRAQEVGIRMALGARAGEVVRLVGSDVMVLVAVGIVAGVFLSLVAMRLLTAAAARVSAMSRLELSGPIADVATLAGVAVVIAAAGAAAALFPTRRATRIDPLAALRHQ